MEKCIKARPRKVALGGNRRGIRSYKVSKRKDLDISAVSGAFALKMDHGRIREIRLSYGGMAEMTKRAATAETFLTGKEWNRTTVEEAMLILEQEFTPLSDARAEKEFRTTAAKNLLLKFYTETL